MYYQLFRTIISDICEELDVSYSFLRSRSIIVAHLVFKTGGTTAFTSFYCDNNKIFWGEGGLEVGRDLYLADLKAFRYFNVRLPVAGEVLRHGLHGQAEKEDRVREIHLADPECISKIRYAIKAFQEQYDKS